MEDGVRRLAPGDVFAGCLIESLAGRGGMGLVYRARQRSLDRMVAVKVIKPDVVAGDSELRARFEQEASLAAQIEHPNVIPIHDVGEEDGLLYIIMRFVESTDLGELLRKHGRLAPERAVRCVTQIAAALDAAHARGLVHRDVKPANVLVAGAVADEHLYLTDFGLARRVSDFGAGPTRLGAFVGTLDYSAPEQILGANVDAQSDVYALGAVLYELLTGVVPFPREYEATKVFAHLSLPPPLPSDLVSLPPELDAVVVRAMAKDPDVRFHSAGELARAASHAARPPETRPRHGRPRGESEHTRLLARDAPRVRQRSPDDRVDKAEPRPAPAAAARVRFNLPVVAASFAGRENELDALDSALGVPDRGLITHAITGLGGVGKSQLAARYVQRRTDEYDVVAWIRAEDGGITDLAQLAAKLGEPVDRVSPSERAQLGLNWLSDTTQSWLLVLDNVASPEQLDRCRPHSGHGRVLVTSRDRALRQFGPVLAVDVFDEDTATAYLTNRAERPHDKCAARNLARALGCLPLALSHAAAYCQSGTSFAEYLELLGELPARELFDDHPELSYAQTVASTWKASIEAASAAAPLAYDALGMAAYLAPDAIPKALLLVLVDANTMRGRKSLTDALNALARFSLATVDDEALSVHRLLQQTVRDDDRARDDRTAALRALTGVHDAFPNDVRQPKVWPLCEQLLPHALALVDAFERADDADPRLISLLTRACEYHSRAESGLRALTITQTTVRHAARVVGAAHPDTLTARDHLASAHHWAWHPREAIAIYEALLIDRERILGTDHPDTLTTRHNLARAYYSQAGRTDAAIAIAEALLDDRERILGAEHPDTLSTRHNLAEAYHDAGRITEAIAICEALLPVRERILGSEQPETLNTRDNLARAYHAAGRTSEAIAIYEAVLSDRERILGTEHHRTLTTRHNLAEAYHAAGRTAEAIAIYRTLLADRQRTLGNDHPETRATRAKLAAATAPPDATPPSASSRDAQKRLRHTRNCP